MNDFIITSYINHYIYVFYQFSTEHYNILKYNNLNFIKNSLAVKIFKNTHNLKHKLNIRTNVK